MSVSGQRNHSNKVCTSAVNARTLLDHLLTAYSLPTSKHPLQSGLAVDDVFLLGEPANAPNKPSTSSAPAENKELAIVNLRGSFVDNHPSGIQVEALTLQSIIGTLHAALPDVTSIRFLVDGQPHDTLAGHADLLRTYPAVDTTVHPAPPTETPQL